MARVVRDDDNSEHLLVDVRIDLPAAWTPEASRRGLDRGRGARGAHVNAGEGLADDPFGTFGMDVHRGAVLSLSIVRRYAANQAGALVVDPPMTAGQIPYARRARS